MIKEISKVNSPQFAYRFLLAVGFPLEDKFPFFSKKLWTVFIVCTSESTCVVLFSSRAGCFTGHEHYHLWNQAILSVSWLCCFGVSLWCKHLCKNGVWQLRDPWQLVWSADNGKNQRSEVFELNHKQERNAKVKAIITTWDMIDWFSGTEAV